MLIEQARKLVIEKLGDYKDTSKCVTDINYVYKFFDETEDIVGIDTETTGLNTFTDDLVGISLCNGKEALYLPINHKSSIYNTRLVNQLNPDDVRKLFDKVTKEKRFKWVSLVGPAIQ